MRLTSTLLILSLAIASCGGETAPTYADAYDALEKGAVAASGNDAAAAHAAFDFVLAGDADAATKYQAAAGKFKLAPTAAGFETLASTYADQLDAKGVRKLADACVLTRNIEAGNTVLAFAAKNYASDASLFESPMAAMDALQSDPGADLSAIGYAGD